MSELARVAESKGTPGLLSPLRTSEGPDLESLVRRLGPRLYGVAKRYLSHDQQIAEVLQDAFSSALERSSDVLGTDQIESRIYERLLEACALRMQFDFAGDQREIASLLPRFDATGHRISRLSPQAKHANAEQLRRAVRALPATHRAVYLFHDAEGLGVDAIADLLELTPAQVRTCLSLARQAILMLLSA